MTVIVTVTLSILAHGLSAAPAARWYGRLVQKQPDCAEARPVSEMPTRAGKAAAGD